MSETSLRSFSPLRPETRPIGWRGAAVLIGAALLVLSFFQPHLRQSSQVLSKELPLMTSKFLTIWMQFYQWTEL